MKKILLAMLFGAMTLTSFAEGKLKVVAAYGGKEKIFQQFSKDTGIEVDFIDMSSGK